MAAHPEPYLAPPYVNMRTGERTPDSDKLTWLAWAIDSGTRFLENQRAWSDCELGYSVIDGEYFKEDPGELSNVSTNRTKRQIRETISSLGNLRVVSKYKTFNREFVNRLESLNRLFIAWWDGTGADYQWKNCLKYACPCGTGYLNPYWNADFWAPGQGEIDLGVYGPRDVLPIQIPRNHNLQQAYAVLIRKATPIDLARRTWPEFAGQIVADRDAPVGFRKVVSQAARYASSVLNKFGIGTYMREDAAPYPEVDVWECYILDSTINTSGREIALGSPGSSWSYVVPYLGQELPGSMAGEFRRADREDCRMFPLRRCMVATKTCVFDDGPNPYHHGKVPLIQMRVDDWPWNFLGYSMAREGASLERANIGMMRDIVDANRARLNPPFAYDSDRMTEDAAAQINPRLPGQTIPMQLGGVANLEQVYKTLVPPQMYDVPANIPAFIKEQEARQDFQMGVADISALVKAKQLPASDGLEKLLQAMGPLSEDLARNQEGCMNQLGPFIKSLQFQFYSPKQIISILGYDIAQQIPELFDGEPGNLIPSHMPGEDKTKVSNFPRWRRAQWFANEFNFQLEPYSLHKLQQTSRKLSISILQKQGFPIDPWTIAELYEIHDFGEPPEGATTVWQRWVEWERLQAAVKAEIAQKLQAMGIGQPAGGPGQGHGGGRPHSMQVSPTLATKDQGTRPITRTSQR